jgi:Lrp/AsnC family transcriptional regulator, leucine-responsive regulatory protein
LFHHEARAFEEFRFLRDPRGKAWQLLLHSDRSVKESAAMSDLDATDRRILTVLQKEGRITNADLSERVNLSPSACHRRVQRLEEEGYIAAYVALLDARRMGRPTTVFVEITLQGQADELLDAFEREVARVPDILECHLMAGTADYLLKIMAQDTEDFARIHRQYLTRLPGVAQMHSSFALRTVFKTTALAV